jgi:hypothetical protein
MNCSLAGKFSVQIIKMNNKIPICACVYQQRCTYWHITQLEDFLWPEALNSETQHPPTAPPPPQYDIVTKYVYVYNFSFKNVHKRITDKYMLSSYYNRSYKRQENN